MLLSYLYISIYQGVCERTAGQQYGDGVAGGPRRALRQVLHRVHRRAGQG